MRKPATRRSGAVRCAIYTRKSSEEGLEQEFKFTASAARGTHCVKHEKVTRTRFSRFCTDP